MIARGNCIGDHTCAVDRYGNGKEWWKHEPGCNLIRIIAPGAVMPTTAARQQRKREQPHPTVPPKGTDLSPFRQHEFNDIAERLNDSPRKILGFQAPNDVFGKFIANLPAERSADAVQD
ncbi:MAG: hypothetical protein ABI240_08105 [Sphingomonas sp.]